MASNNSSMANNPELVVRVENRTSTHNLTNPVLVAEVINNITALYDFSNHIATYDFRNHIATYDTNDK